MQMIMDALSPEQLSLMRDVFAKEDARLDRLDPAAQTEVVDAACRRRAESTEDQADRLAFANRKERRLQKALAR